MIDSFLKENGYSDRKFHGSDGVFYWYKRLPETELHQVTVRMYPPLKPSHEPSFEIEMTYEPRGKIWAETKYYGLSQKEFPCFAYFLCHESNQKPKVRFLYIKDLESMASTLWEARTSQTIHCEYCNKPQKFLSKNYKCKEALKNLKYSVAGE